MKLNTKPAVTVSVWPVEHHAEQLFILLKLEREGGGGGDFHGLFISFLSGTAVRHCGADHCPAASHQSNVTSPSQSNPEDSLMVTLISVYMGFVVVGLLVTVFLLKSVQPCAAVEHPGTVRLLTSTVRHLVNDVNMMLLVPFSLYLGMEQAVLFAEFTMVCENQRL